MSRLVEQVADATNAAVGDRPDFFVNIEMARAATITVLNAVSSALGSSLNLHIIEMKEGYDDSIVGFNQAWDVVRNVLADLRGKAAVARAEPAPPEAKS